MKKGEKFGSSDIGSDNIYYVKKSPCQLFLDENL